MKTTLSTWLKTSLLTLAFAAAGMAQAASTTNYADQWGTDGENGWGLSVLQQGDVIFIDMFVFGPDGKPTWYVVGANFDGFTQAGHLVFSGDLFAVTGPYFGAPVYNEALVGGGKVGTFTFDSDSVNTATITYNVGGVFVTKNVHRTFWAFENFAGDYYGGLVYDASGCGVGSNGHFTELGPISLTHTTGASATLTLTSTPVSGGSCSYSGAYSQSGHMGSAAGSYSCSGGQTGTFNFFEMEKSISGMTGRFTSLAGTCALEGRFGGVLLQ